jgi:3-methyladenine DNA glycosylase/8-oxoguanine DNA glycosylase
VRRFDICLDEPAPRPFDFESTARAHGWVRLSPFAWHAPTAELHRIHRLASGKVVRLRLANGGTMDNPVVRIKVETLGALSPSENAEIRRAVRRMLRLDEDLSGFYELCDAMREWSLGIPPGAGRLLRCPTLFEDIVYTLCTTNTTWAGTIRMVDCLVATLGETFPGQQAWRAFPTVEAIAAAGENCLAKEVRLGYRSRYLWQLAVEVAEGHLDLASLEDPSIPVPELRRTLLRIKGIGSYAAATLLMLVGRYEHLAIDSQMRAFVAKKYFQGQPVSLAQIRATYAPWGRWQYLAYWFDP